MKCFSLDSAGKTAGVALMEDGRLLYEAYLNSGNTHSVSLLPLVESAFNMAGITAKDIDLFAVNAGPGSFTGIRIGLALVKGLALPYNTPCVGTSTLESLAYGFGGEGTILAALDARRGDVYYAAFTKHGAQVQRLTEDSAAPAIALKSFAEKAEKPLWIIGDGGDICAKAFGDISGVKQPEEIFKAPRGAGVCLAAMAQYENKAYGTAAELTAEYHRLSQAERERQEREQKT
ncbi:MAG: tRNA (adenosine(37)-N6)-threonylcarbamoyltransferase complex dimerization subunit type 1 TsaB [Oscillospiraceae bacterium]